MSPVVATLLIVLGIFILFLFIKFIPVRHWIAAIFANVKISIFSLIGMRLRRVPAEVIVNALIQAQKAGLEVDSDTLEAHYLARGNVERVIDALVAADKANIELSIQRTTAIDLAGRDVLEAVKMSVNPKVIETPEVAAVAIDGIQLKAIARVTVRANLDRLVGGAGE
ncbi:MAG: flotillin-like FloA family protein, partial [Victivallales bacterium]|nr:flotillin-like FloA family protein [Victivallales bacterium]